MMKKKRSTRFGLVLMFTGIVFLALLVNTAVTALLVHVLVQNGVIVIASYALPESGRLLLFNALISIPIGALIAFISSEIPLKPVRRLVDSMHRLAEGDFRTRIESDGILWKYPAFSQVSESFNTLAEELEHTEMLRSDYINNFSHEFKTPIVSIAGFAKVLKRGNLSEEQQREYLSVIEEESIRLAYMATNVLNLTKVENQAILTDVTRYNLSEQIRSCVLLLENKWDRKSLDMQLDFDEYEINASEELLKQVWINLLDNAIKFAPVGHMVQIRITEQSDCLQVDITNTGSEIAPEEQKKIFGKFYQADTSHATHGNGVGLAIVKRIVDLHGGLVEVDSAQDVTTFTVILPKEN